MKTNEKNVLVKKALAKASIFFVLLLTSCVNGFIWGLRAGTDRGYLAAFLSVLGFCCAAYLIGLITLNLLVPRRRSAMQDRLVFMAGTKRKTVLSREPRPRWKTWTSRVVMIGAAVGLVLSVTHHKRDAVIYSSVVLAVLIYFEIRNITRGSA